MLLHECFLLTGPIGYEIHKLVGSFWLSSNKGGRRGIN